MVGDADGAVESEEQVLRTMTMTVMRVCRVQSTFAAALFVATSSLSAMPGPSQSAEAAKQLAAALTQHKLDAIAAHDPDDPDRFIAALYFPGVQLLVVSARYPAPSLIESKLAQKQFRDVYLDLQSSPVTGSSMFFQDMNADGLCTDRSQAADVMYNGSATPTIFDAAWEKRKISEKAYEQQYTVADQQYRRLLEILLTQLEPGRTR